MYSFLPDSTDVRDCASPVTIAMIDRGQMDRADRALGALGAARAYAMFGIPTQRLGSTACVSQGQHVGRRRMPTQERIDLQRLRLPGKRRERIVAFGKSGRLGIMQAC